MVICMQILECKYIKEKEIIKLKKLIKHDLTLAVIQIGNFKENNLYLRSKKKLAQELGVKIIELSYQESNSKEEIIHKIVELNLDNHISGIMSYNSICYNR